MRTSIQQTIRFFAVRQLAAVLPVLLTGCSPDMASPDKISKERDPRPASGAYNPSGLGQHSRATEQPSEKVHGQREDTLAGLIEDRAVSEQSDSEDTQQVQDRRGEPSASAAMRLSLEEAINMALTSNRGLLDAKDRVEGAGLSLAIAESEFELKIFPGGSVGFTGGSGADSDDDFGAGFTVQKTSTLGTDIAIQPNVQKSLGIYDTGVDVAVRQPLLRGFDQEFNLSSVHGAEFADRSARRSLYLTKVDTVLRTITAVYQVIRQRELLRLNQESAQRLRGHVEAARAKEKAGLANSIDTYRATIQLKQAEDNLVTARESYSDALDSLKVLLALPLETELDVNAPLTYDTVNIDEGEALIIALENRVELGQASDTIREAMRRSRVTKHNVLPDLDVIFNYSKFGQGGTFSRSRSLDEDVWGLSFAVNTDLARTAERAAYKQSLLTVKAASRNESLQKDDIIRQVKQELRNLRKSGERITIQDTQIKQARGQLALSRVKFEQGLASNFDVIDAETELRRAQTNLLSAVLDYIIGSHHFRASLGTLVARPEAF